MTDPVMVVETGHSYERAAIEKWFASHSSDPTTNVRVHDKTVVPNVTLRKTIQQWQEQRQKRSPAQAPRSAAPASPPPPVPWTWSLAAQPSLAQSAPRPSAAVRQEWGQPRFTRPTSPTRAHPAEAAAAAAAALAAAAAAPAAAGESGEESEYDPEYESEYGSEEEEEEAGGEEAVPPQQAVFGTPAPTSPRINFAPFSGFPISPPAPAPVLAQPLGVCCIHLVRTDLLHCGADAIVSSTSPTMRSRGGALERAIHARCGPALAAELAALAQASGRFGAPLCTAGTAIATSAPNIPHCQRIFHTVAPALDAGMQMQPAVLASCYRSCLSLAAAHNVRTVAFPPLATGALQFPRAAAAQVAVQTIAAFTPRWRPDCRVELVAPDEAAFLCLQAALQDAGGPLHQRLG